jgi:ubiquinone/menaquinone biosynthesis C-methylase UbiE
MTDHTVNTPDTLPDARLSAQKVEAIYDSLSSFYDIWGGLTESKARNRGIALSNIQEGEQVLEVAAGTGLILRQIAPLNRTGTIYGVDISQGMLAKAQHKLKEFHNINLKQASALALPFNSQQFDLVFNAYMFDLLPYQQMPAVMAEFWRVLKPGGRMVLINMTEGEKFGSQLYQKLYNLNPSLLGGCRGVRMANSVTETGFNLQLREYYQQMFFPSEVLLAKKPVNKISQY